MSENNFEKRQGTDEEVRLNLNIDTGKRDTETDLKKTEVVYKPTTMDSDKKWNQKFQSFKPVVRDDATVILKDSFFLYRTAFLGNLLAFSAGIGFSWSSPVLPKLHESDSPLTSPISESEESIIASILCIGAAIGPFLFGYLADKIGRKKTLIVVALPMVIGTTILAFTSEIKLYYLGRLLYGMGNGGAFTVLTMYIGEITADHNRGKFGCILGIFVALGVLYPFGIGSILSIRVFCLSCLIPLQIFLIFFTIYAPDSPSYLVNERQFKEAEKALAGLRGIPINQAQKEIAELQQIVERQQKLQKGGISVLFKTRGTRRAFMISAGLLILQQCSGINAVTGFMEHIFRSTGSGIPPKLAATLIGVIQVVTVYVTSTVIDKLGRKFLLLASSLGGAVSIILLGLYFFLYRQKVALLAYFWWLPIACLLMYIICFNLGLGPVPWAILSEIFPDNVKSSASALVSSTCFAVSFVVTMAFPILSEMLGMAECFFLFGICCIIGVVFIQFAVPETKGKNVAEIQEILSK